MPRQVLLLPLSRDRRATAQTPADRVDTLPTELVVW